MDYIERVTGTRTDELVAVFQDRDKTMSNYLSIIPSSNNRILMEYWNSCYI